MIPFKMSLYWGGFDGARAIPPRDVSRHVSRRDTPCVLAYVPASHTARWRGLSTAPIRPFSDFVYLAPQL